MEIALFITSLFLSSISGEKEPLVRQLRHYDDSRYRSHGLRFEQILVSAEKDSEESKPVFKKAGLVPQLFANYSGIPLPPAESVSCSEAQVQCAYRAGCGLALQNYFLGCSDLVKGKGQREEAPLSCTRHCRHSLISLASTLEGSRLMKCDCSGDESCLRSKARLSICEEEVKYATRSDTIVSCSAATWICSADPSCATALDYYHIYCVSMFKGKKCSKRCRNSISILRRQQAAAKLESCYCDGSEDYDCSLIKQNMEDLCFEKMHHEKPESNEIPSSFSPPRIKLSLMAILFVLHQTRLILL